MSYSNPAGSSAEISGLPENVWEFPYPHAYHKTLSNGKPRKSKKNFYIVKRFIDIFFSSIALIVLSPLLLIVAICVKLESKGPVFFRQERIGRHQKPFQIYKFRSMCQDAEERLADLQDKNERDGPVFKISNDPRVTKVGAFLRKTCIDELPQLFNILKGDMSIVGPRPPLPREVDQYTAYQMLRLSVTPGLTCLWQVSDRDMSFEDWVKLDLEYIRKRNIPMDIKLILKTFLVVFKVSGDK